MKEVGRRIKERREYLGYSVDYVAERLGVNRATVYRYESAEIRKVPVQIVEDIAKVLHITPQELMGWADGRERGAG